MVRCFLLHRRTDVYESDNAILLGHLTRIGPNELITDDPEIIRHMSGARTTYGRSYWYDGMVLTPDQDNMLSEKDVGVHDRLKAQMAAGVGTPLPNKTKNPKSTC